MFEHRLTWKTCALLGSVAIAQGATPLAAHAQEEAATEEQAAVPPPPANTCAARAHHAAADSVVRIRSGSRWGAGFVYHSPRHVVTTFGLISLGRPVTVVARDGTQLAANLLARDESYDLAILELAEPVPGARPLEAAPPESAVLGAQVVAIGHPFAGLSSLLGERGEGLLRWSVSQGTIGAVNEAGIQADLSLNDGHAGGPLLDCEGRVLGLIPSSGILSNDLALSARVARADALIGEAGTASEFIGDLRLHFGLGGILQIDEQARVAGGVYGTVGASLFDRISWMNRIGLLFGGVDDPLADELSVERRTIRVESMIGYRFFLDIGGFITTYIVPSIGATINHQRDDRRVVSVVPSMDPACVPSTVDTCAVASIANIVTEQWIVRPAIGLTLIGNTLELGYTLEIHVDPEPVVTVHTLHLGLLF